MGRPQVQEVVRDCSSCCFCVVDIPPSDEENYSMEPECRNPQSEFFERIVDFTDSCSTYGFKRR